jgi:hypothetical protein
MFKVKFEKMVKGFLRKVFPPKLFSDEIRGVARILARTVKLISFDLKEIF